MIRIKMILLAMVFTTFNAWAAPGYEVTSFQVSPLEEANFIAAIDEWMNSPAAKKGKGRIYLQRHDNDGANPATHSIINIYSSMAEAEKYGNMVTSDKKALASWMTMIGKVVPISTLTLTARYTRAGAWGTISDKDKVWVQHSFTSRDGASLYRAIDAWMNSAAGKTFPGQLHLSRTVAAGMGAGSHVLVIGYESFAEMEAWNQKLGGSVGFTQLMHTFSVINKYNGASISVDIKAWGESLKSVLK